MKKILVLFLSAMLTGCYTISYKKCEAEGVCEELYCSSLRPSGTEQIMGNLGSGRTINVQGQKGVDPEILKALMKAAGVAF